MIQIWHVLDLDFYIIFGMSSYVDVTASDSDITLI